MSEWKVVVVALDGDHARAIDLERRLRAGWSARRPAVFVARRTSDLASEIIEELDAVVVIVVPGSESHPTLALLSGWEEAGIPVVALLDESPPPDNPFDFTHTLIKTGEPDDRVLCATLHGLLHRQVVVRRLRGELALSHRFHGGMEDEIAKMHEELQLAAMVQREFLPREVPFLHGVSFAALWRPTNYVSGDIYDLIPLDADHVGVFIADAVGHGVPAALMTMVITRALVTREMSGSVERIVPPSEVLARLNAAMMNHEGRTTRFATAAYGVMNCHSRTLVFAGAGHPPPLILRAGGAVESIETEGGLLGIFEDEKYDQIELELCVGDTMLWYSDGFEQAFPRENAETRLERKLPTTRYREEFLRLGSMETPEKMIAAMNRRLDDQCGSLHQLDDLTLICMKTGPLAAPSPQEPSRTAVSAVNPGK